MRPLFRVSLCSCLVSEPFGSCAAARIRLVVAALAAAADAADGTRCRTRAESENEHVDEVVKCIGQLCTIQRY